ncbi:hypothetical protein PPTG_07960 [Phytophthora nicotianae INRA-310]|uniref:Uncharacterized protein n=6 Tax=Phytophthora nicotianae TaxID=4792 RepID=W2QQ28_PHYN3|nr:hypothetical protein PPTG_07960 [Phytophthora nicotianae INRA-310]ETI53701.1 hypothetical protein F443_03396 [Phytophthora nicotianae P1569]ETN14340.1 hypothetical protein PPTG_07960 [Phytophthora nicotianae INRA-310]
MERFVDHLADPIWYIIHTDVLVSFNKLGQSRQSGRRMNRRSSRDIRVTFATSLGHLQSGKLHFQPEIVVVVAAVGVNTSGR